MHVRNVDQGKFCSKMLRWNAAVRIQTRDLPPAKPEREQRWIWCMGEVELSVADKAFGAKLVWVVVHL